MWRSLSRFRRDRDATGPHGACRRVVRLCLRVLLICAAASGVRADSFPEVEVRAIYLFNFAAFVDWPAVAFESASSPIRYCVLGSRSLRIKLEDVLSGEQVERRLLEVVDAPGPQAWRRCHVLYLDHSAAEDQHRVLAAVRGAPVLTVGDTDAFARTGGMVGLVRKGRRVRTLIDREATAQAGIKVSSKLLRLSTLTSDQDMRKPP